MTGIEDGELWASHADWWQREFTDGVDADGTARPGHEERALMQAANRIAAPNRRWV